MPSLPWAELSWKPEPKEFIGSYAATPGPRARQRGWTWRGQEDPSDLKNRDPGGISVPELELSWEQDKAEQKKNDQSRCQVAWCRGPCPDPFIGCAHSPGDRDDWLPAALSVSPGRACPWLKGSYLAGEPGTHSHPRPGPICDAALTPYSTESPSWLGPSPSSPTESTLPAKHFLRGSHSALFPGTSTSGAPTISRPCELLGGEKSSRSSEPQDVTWMIPEFTGGPQKPCLRNRDAPTWVPRGSAGRYAAACQQWSRGLGRC